MRWAGGERDHRKLLRVRLWGHIKRSSPGLLLTWAMTGSRVCTHMACEVTAHTRTRTLPPMKGTMPTVDGTEVIPAIPTAPTLGTSSLSIPSHQPYTLPSTFHSVYPPINSRHRAFHWREGACIYVCVYMGRYLVCYAHIAHTCH